MCWRQEDTPTVNDALAAVSYGRDLPSRPRRDHRLRLESAPGRDPRPDRGARAGDAVRRRIGLTAPATSSAAAPIPNHKEEPMALAASPPRPKAPTALAALVHDHRTALREHRLGGPRPERPDPQIPLCSSRCAGWPRSGTPSSSPPGATRRSATRATPCSTWTAPRTAPSGCIALQRRRRQEPLARRVPPRALVEVGLVTRVEQPGGLLYGLSAAGHLAFMLAADQRLPCSMPGICMSCAAGQRWPEPHSAAECGRRLERRSTGAHVYGPHAF